VQEEEPRIRMIATMPDTLPTGVGDCCGMLRIDVGLIGFILKVFSRQSGEWSGVFLAEVAKDFAKLRMFILRSMVLNFSFQ